jgi:EAL domain-containing protein (putative c-di-GMP-specific phosphodiesterase class I)
MLRIPRINRRKESFDGLTLRHLAAAPQECFMQAAIQHGPSWGGTAAMVDDRNTSGFGEVVPFGRRPIPPRACVLENKTHVRTFLAEMLDGLGFIAREAAAVDVRTMLRDFRPDLIVLGPLDGGPEVRSVMEALRAQGFGAKVMLFGGRSSAALIRNYEFGEAAGLAMLPPLGTPFRDRDLYANLDGFLPVRPAPPLPVDVDEALYNGWLELWYQSKINPRSLVPCGAEALVRVRHPTWGVVAPAYYIPGASDPFLHGLSQFAVARVLADSMQFAAGNHDVRISIRLPLQALEDMQFIDRLMAHLPDKVRRNGFLIAVDCVDLVKELGLVRGIAVQLAARNIGISIVGIDAQGATLAGRRELPVVEMKVDRKFINGCADDRIKQAHCAQIVAIARDTGAKSVAEGVETQADFLVVRDLGFDLLQGHMFAKPMAAHKFERAMLARRYAAVA